MNDVGTHSKPVNGVVTNGHAPTLASFTVPQLEIRQSGPMTPWPHPAAPDRWRHVTSAVSAMAAHRGWLAAVPVVLVNAVAFAGQLAFLRTHLPWTPAGQVLVAITLESVAVYLAWQAHLALAADDSALRLRLAAYGFAAVIGVMNYSHWMASGWRPTFTAVTFGLMSVSSPWLWSVHSRRSSRDALKARGLIEPHAVRLGATRWTWHPLRSAKVMFRATWVAENDPAVAIGLPAIKAAGEVTASVAANEQVTSAAVREVTPEPPVQVTPEPVSSQAPEVTSSQVPSQPDAVQVKPQARPRRKAQATSPRISDTDLKQDIRELHGVDPAVSVNAAAKQLGRSRDRVRPLLEQVRAEAAS